MIVVDGYVLPFSEVLDWSRASIRVHPHDVYQLFDILEKISEEQETELREQVSKGMAFISYIEDTSRLTIVSREAKKKQHTRPLSELFTT